METDDVDSIRLFVKKVSNHPDRRLTYLINYSGETYTLMYFNHTIYTFSPDDPFIGELTHSVTKFDEPRDLFNITIEMFRELSYDSYDLTCARTGPDAMYR